MWVRGRLIADGLQRAIDSAKGTGMAKSKAKGKGGGKGKGKGC